MQASARQRVLIDVLLPEPVAESRLGRLAVDAALVLGFALLVAVFAQIAIRIPTTTVPITGQTFGVLLAGGALGSRRGGLSMLVYMVIGILGAQIESGFLAWALSAEIRVPGVFAPGSSVLGEGQVLHFILPWSGSHGLVWSMSSGGYIVGFVLAGYLVGLLAERGWDRRSTVPLAMLAGNIAIYVVGLPWLAVHIANNGGIYDFISGTNVLDKTLKGGLYPFIGGDALKLLLAAMVLPGAWTLVDQIKGRNPK